MEDYIEPTEELTREDVVKEVRDHLKSMNKDETAEFIVGIIDQLGGYSYNECSEAISSSADLVR